MFIEDGLVGHIQRLYSVLSTLFTDMVGEFSFDQKPSTVGQPDETFEDYVCNRKNMNG